MNPVTLQILGNALLAIAEEMEAALVRAAFSPNITERRDCSTAVFDADGRMIVQAAAIPVHLGAMPEAVAAVRERNPRPGEVWALNDPYRGGTHLPDITLIAPIAIDGDIVAYSVSRAHHADIGGMAPGSMPAGSTELIQEGIVIPPTRVVVDGRTNADVIDLVVANSRTGRERRGDLAAQLACHRLAERRLTEVVARYGRDVVTAAFDALVDYAERRTRAALEAMPDGTWEASESLEGDGVTEDAIPIRVRVTVEGSDLHVDFTGTSAAVRGNVNCPLAVTRSAVYFVVRAVTDPDIPSSAGAFAPVRITAPEGSLVNAASPHAVAAGNVETSSRIVDVLFAAFGQAIPVAAQGQGTMNNLVIGTDAFSYYETIGGGQGASPDADGPSGVHVAMSNTRNTPIEVLEVTFPFRVLAYGIRRGTGGDGARRGGDGLEREIQMRAPAEVSILAERRRSAPSGARGGGGGAPGQSTLNGRELPAKWHGHVEPGDVIGIRTPGGGGFGASGKEVVQEPPGSV